MGNIVDINALANIGRSATSSGVRDNTTRDQAVNVFGGLVFKALSNVLFTKKQLNSESNATIANSAVAISKIDNEGMLLESTELLDNYKKTIRKANRNIALGFKTSKWTTEREKAYQNIKGIVDGANWVDHMNETHEGIFKDGTIKVPNPDGKGGFTTRKVSYNGNSSADAMTLASKFADGTIYDALKWDEKLGWGIHTSSIATGELTKDSNQKAVNVKTTFTALKDIQLPELDESEAVFGHRATYETNYYNMGLKSKNRFNNTDKVTLRKKLYNDYSKMTSNQITSAWHAGEGSDTETPAGRYITNKDGYTFTDGHTMVIKDPFDPKLDHSTPEGAVEAAKRMNDYTAALEDFKLHDLDGGEKLNWLIDNYAINDIEKAFNLGHGDRQTETITTDLGRYLHLTPNGQKTPDSVIRGYMDDLTNNRPIVFQDKNGATTTYKPTDDGGYIAPNNKKMSKDDFAILFGLPTNYDYGSVEVEEFLEFFNSDLTGERKNVREKLQTKLGDDYTIEVNDYGDRNDIMIYHNTVKGKEGNKLSIGFDIGDDDAIEKLNRLLVSANTEVTLPTGK